MLTFAVALSANSAAAPWEQVSLNQTENTVPQTFRLQKGGTSASLQTIDSLEIKRAAANLGQISAMARDAVGTIYTADLQSGRIWALSDRGMDGTIDARRPLPQRFDRPTGLASYKATLYVADRKAVWALEPQRDPRQLASLANIESNGGPHLLSIDKKSGSLYLALTIKGNALKVLTVGPIIEQGLQISRETPLTSLALPGQYRTPRNWPPALSNMILAAQDGPGAMQLLAIPTEAAAPGGNPAR